MSILKWTFSGHLVDKPCKFWPGQSGHSVDSQPELEENRFRLLEIIRIDEKSPDLVRRVALTNFSKVENVKLGVQSVPLPLHLRHFHPDTKKIPTGSSPKPYGNLRL